MVTSSIRVWKGSSESAAKAYVIDVLASNRVIVVRRISGVIRDAWVATMGLLWTCRNRGSNRLLVGLAFIPNGEQRAMSLNSRSGGLIMQPIKLFKTYRRRQRIRVRNQPLAGDKLKLQCQMIIPSRGHTGSGHGKRFTLGMASIVMYLVQHDFDAHRV